MSEPTVCVHCGYFIQYQLPKAPAEPGWAHTGHSPTPPIGPPCDTPEPRAVNPADPRPATDGPVVWDSAAPRRATDGAVEWEPTRWWRVVAPDGSLWCETGDETEAREAMRAGDVLWRAYKPVTTYEWRTVAQ